MLEGWDNDRYPTRRGYPPDQVQEHCVRNPRWQRVRLSMKSKPTHIKLEILQKYWDSMEGNVFIEPKWAVECQVGNYLGALRRGGQLDDNNQIRKYL